MRPWIRDPSHPCTPPRAWTENANPKAPSGKPLTSLVVSVPPHTHTPAFPTPNTDRELLASWDCSWPLHFPGHHKDLKKKKKKNPTPVRFGALKGFVLPTQPLPPPLVEPAKLLSFCLGPPGDRGWGSHLALQDRTLQFSGLQRSPHAVQGWTLSSSSLEAPYIKCSAIPNVRRKKDTPSVVLLYVQ